MDDANSKIPHRVKCPKCGELTLFSPENPFRPFCSARCRTLDLGDWASENYRVPTEEAPTADFFEIPENEKN